MGLKFDTKEFRDRLNKLPKSITMKVNAAIAKDAKEWVDMAVRLAPKDPRDGIYLAPSIRSEESSTGGQIVRAGGKTTTRDTKRGPFDYAVGQEFGTQSMPASPYFWVSYRSLKERFKRRRRRALNDAMKDI
jgi:HK97 gp10 family phage protein